MIDSRKYLASYSILMMIMFMAGCSWMRRSNEIDNTYDVMIGNYDINKVNHEFVEFMEVEGYPIVSMIANENYIYHESIWVDCSVLEIEKMLGIIGVRVKIISTALKYADGYQLVLKFEYAAYLAALKGWYECSISADRIREFLIFSQALKNELDVVRKSNIKVG